MTRETLQLTHGTRILCVEDDQDLARDLAAFLEGHGFNVRVAHDVPTGRRIVGDFQPSLCLVDIMLPGPSGRVFCREMADASDVGLIVISALSDSDTIIAMLELGADDYIVKPFRFPEALARCRAVLRRREAEAVVSAVTRMGAWALELQERRLRHVDGYTVKLTPSEAELLRFMAASPGTVFSRADLLAVSRTRQHGGTDDRAVDNLMKRLRKKVEADTAHPRHIITVWGKGYRFDP